MSDTPPMTPSSATVFFVIVMLLVILGMSLSIRSGTPMSRAQAFIEPEGVAILGLLGLILVYCLIVSR